MELVIFFPLFLFVFLQKMVKIPKIDVGRGPQKLPSTPLRLAPPRGRRLPIFGQCANQPTHTPGVFVLREHGSQRPPCSLYEGTGVSVPFSWSVWHEKRCTIDLGNNQEYTKNIDIRIRNNLEIILRNNFEKTLSSNLEKKLGMSLEKTLDRSGDVLGDDGQMIAGGYLEAETVIDLKQKRIDGTVYDVIGSCSDDTGAVMESGIDATSTENIGIETVTRSVKDAVCLNVFMHGKMYTGIVVIWQTLCACLTMSSLNLQVCLFR
ncbi:uncharacterized protein LOC119733460 [Patiria miniata]|uniref:Uncharacterized protein n=1 Tax=Patiria miniata TaxID=46514 RepID=A0A914AGX5_PATMI|nr:uncharacterized protein LOC119733460 [Patiria miniata]